MRIAPWGVILLVLLALTSVMLGARSIVDDIRARREIHAARLLSDRLTVLLDSLTHAPYTVGPRLPLTPRFPCSKPSC